MTVFSSLGQSLGRGALLGALVACGTGGAVAAERAVQIEHDGLTLNATLVTPDAATDVPARVLLMTHGTLAHGQMSIMAALQAALAERGIATLSHTLSLSVNDRSGMADCATTHSHTHADAVAEIAAWHGWLTAEGAGAVPVLGHSRGGNQVAQFAAATDDPALTGVVLMAPATFDAGEAAASYESRYGAPLAPLLDEARAADPASTMTVPGFVYCADAVVTPAAFLGYHAPDPAFDTPSLLDDIAAPTLVVVAGDDAVVPDLPARLEAVNAAGLDGVEIVTVEGADHMFLEFFAEDAADAIAGFLGE